MTTGIVINELFDGNEIRIFNKNGTPMMPLVDIAKTIGYDRSTIRRVIENNSTFFEDGFKGVVAMTTPGGVQELICLTRDGVIALFMALNINRVKDKKKQETILKFRKWAINTLSKAMSGNITEIKPFDKNVIVRTDRTLIGSLVEDQLQIADAMSKYAHVDRGMAISMALSKVEFDTGADLSMWKNTVHKDKVSKPIGYLTVTEIGRELRLGNYAGASVNRILNKLGFLERFSDHWILTQKGDTYAEALPVTGISPSGKSYARYQFKWQLGIVKILHDHLFKEYPSTNNGLLSGYL